MKNTWQYEGNFPGKQRVKKKSELKKNRNPKHLLDNSGHLPIDYVSSLLTVFLCFFSICSHQGSSLPQQANKMNFPSLDGLRMWKSAILLFVFVSLGKFCETWRNTTLIAIQHFLFAWEKQKRRRKIYVMCAVLFLCIHRKRRANSGLLFRLFAQVW